MSQVFKSTWHFTQKWARIFISWPQWLGQMIFKSWPWSVRWKSRVLTTGQMIFRSWPLVLVRWNFKSWPLLVRWWDQARYKFVYKLKNNLENFKISCRSNAIYITAGERSAIVFLFLFGNPTDSPAYVTIL